MLDIIRHNPYRLAGVFSPPSKREIIANITRIKANIRVNRQIAFHADLNELLTPITRNSDNISDAESKLTRPQDVIQYAQFWFIETTNLDTIALGNLNAGLVDKALSIWEKKENLSSLHNQVITHLAIDDYEKAMQLAFLFYGKYSAEFSRIILGEENKFVEPNKFAFVFLDTLCDELGATDVSKLVVNKEWGNYVRNKIIASLIDKINRSISLSEGSKGKSAKTRLNAGTKLMADTLVPLRELRNELSVSNSQYQIIADKLGLEILQCGIDGFNASEVENAAFKALKLQKYAQSVVVGSMAKDRCSKNIHILESIISQLPPIEVSVNHKVIEKNLREFSLQPHLIQYSIQLIKKCAEQIVEIKEKLGKFHEYYLKISTTIVDNALGNVIEEVNEALEKDFNVLKSVLISAWNTQLYMDKFDLEPTYNNGRYKECRKSLHNIIANCKGFEKSSLSFMYEYGCGWCNDIDTSDVDLRTENEFFSSCSTLDSYKEYKHRYPSGKHIHEANIKIEELRYEACKTITDYQKFLRAYPNSRYATKAKQAIDKLTQEEKEIEIKIVQQEKAISSCKSLNEIIALFTKEKTKGINYDRCSIKAFELAKGEDDYRKVISTFGTRSAGGMRANLKIDAIERKRQERAERFKTILKWIIWISVPAIIITAVYLIWGVRGFAVGCTIMAIISGLATLGSIEKSSCTTMFICAAITAILGFSAAKLHQWADNIEKEHESEQLYSSIVRHPSRSECAAFIDKFRQNEHADKVREIWLKLLTDEAKTFDYSSYNPSSYSNINDTVNPIKNLQTYINKNERTSFGNKAKKCIEAVCDSLYDAANRTGTKAGWKQYQKIVPTDYFRDSEQKIEEIEEHAWNTEEKAWSYALSENTISAYQKYESLYPNGSHINLCEKNLIDLEVSRVSAGEHGSLPEMDKTGYGGGSTSDITVSNSTSYTLTLLYSGPDSKRLIIGAGRTSSVRLKNGSYRVAASVSASDVSNYAGTEELRGGSYSVDYYISTYRY